MTIGTAVFTYNRAEHTSRTLEALRRNNILPGKLFLFHDGPRVNDEALKWEGVQTVLDQVDWCEKEIIVSKTNKGLADSIVEGVSHVLEECDAIIVLEDDCVTHPQFMDYMIEALSFYSEKKQVYSVSGYGEPIDVDKDEYSVYFTGRISSWGWGTWKDRWKTFERDYGVLRRIKRNPVLRSAQECWGQDLEDMFLASASAKNDSWAVLWALHVIENNGYNLAPYESLVENIGFDGTGVHCGTSKPLFNVQQGTTSFKLPIEPFFRDEVKEAICDYYSKTSRLVKEISYKKLLISLIKMRQKGQTIADVLKNSGISTVSIYGDNEITEIIIDDCKEYVDIKSIVLSKAVSEANKDGIPMVDVRNVDNDAEAILVVPYYDIQKIEKKLRENGYLGEIIPMDSIAAFDQNKKDSV